MILFKNCNNYFKFQDGKIFSYGKGENAPTIGAWFKCKEEESERIMEKLLRGECEVVPKIPGLTKREEE